MWRGPVLSEYMVETPFLTINNKIVQNLQYSNVDDLRTRLLFMLLCGEIVFCVLCHYKHHKKTFEAGHAE